MITRKTSIAVTVGLTLVTVTTLVLIILGAVSYQYQGKRELETMQTALALDADQIAPSLNLPVWTFDRPEIDKVVEGMMLDPFLQGIMIKSADNKTILCARVQDAQGNGWTRNFPPLDS